VTALQHIRAALPKATADLDEASHALGHVWTADDHAAIGHLTNATEALVRASASLTLALERLAQYVDAIDVEV